ncbi:hypothetical protein [Pseudomonas cedrina]|nr:hypothetical protein [Pseudomonas cedrina]MDQ0651476.1 hypothetical protein [Pseudomonas cedrina]
MPAMAVDQYLIGWLTHRHRRQASSHSGFVQELNMASSDISRKMSRPA